MPGNGYFPHKRNSFSAEHAFRIWWQFDLRAVRGVVLEMNLLVNVPRDPRTIIGKRLVEEFKGDSREILSRMKTLIAYPQPDEHTGSLERITVAL